MTPLGNIVVFFSIFVFCISDGGKKKVKWTPEEEEELQRVFEEHKDSGGETPFYLYMNIVLYEPKHIRC